jgi:hypothetical protein
VMCHIGASASGHVRLPRFTMARIRPRRNHLPSTMYSTLIAFLLIPHPPSPSRSPTGQPGHRSSGVDQPLPPRIPDSIGTPTTIRVPAEAFITHTPHIQHAHHHTSKHSAPQAKRTNLAESNLHAKCPSLLHSYCTHTAHSCHNSHPTELKNHFRKPSLETL